MKLSQLLAIYPQLKWGQHPHIEVTGLTQDSREVSEGCVFVAVRGYVIDGHEFLPDACHAGAAAVVVESEDNIPADFRGAIVTVGKSREALDILASRFFGNPAEQLFCVGVTGTNGKTSVTYMVEKVLSDFGWKTGVLGTIDHHLGQKIWQTSLTTPGPVVLQKRLREFKALGAKSAVFEVSSHALKQSRVDQIPFDVAVFTNLTRDHLDYHDTMEDYFQAKERLFNEVLWKTSKEVSYAIINSDDPYGRRLQVADKARVWTYGEKNADFVFQILDQDFSGSRFALKTPRGEVEVRVGSPGLHNIYNATAAIAVGVAAGISPEACAQSMAQFVGVPGRLERVPLERDLNVFVDYAHTDDALRSVLRALNDIRRQNKASTRLITVFGCGGDRDKGKRPLMARAAVEGSDLVFITSDNPRTEDPGAIIKDSLVAVDPQLLNQSVFQEVDRRTAIARALQMAHEGDVILIAGKGHEDYQIIGQEKRPFSDFAVVKELCS